MKLYLAPMEGVTDWLMRDTLTKLGGIDYCVTEFLRVTKTLHPNKIFIRHCPELLTKSRTRTGTPVIFQLLGGDPSPMAENAQRVAELGAAGIDLNFGCPAKTVNRHDGGAILLKSPHRLYDILKKVRESVPQSVPVSGKIRLGFEDTSLCLENAKALQEAGAQWITVHCRTKRDGYRPPAHWNWVPRIAEVVSVPIVANGDIQCLNSFAECQKETKASHFMIGRASLSDPYLFTKIKDAKSTPSPNLVNLPPNLEAASPNIYEEQSRLEWRKIEGLLMNFYFDSQSHINGHFATSRTKQWLKYLSLKNPQAKILFDQIKTFHNPTEFQQNLESALHINSQVTYDATPSL